MGERFIVWGGWPGRPEFVESTYYLYRVSRGSAQSVAQEQATKDPFYLRVGERILNDIRDRTMTTCGFATIKDLETGEVGHPPTLILALAHAAAGRSNGVIYAV